VIAGALMAKDFARGEHMMRRPDLQQGQQRETDQLQQSSQRGRFQPNWAKQGSALDTSDDDVLPPIPAHLKTNAWMKRYSQKDFQLDQTPSSEKNSNLAQTIAAVPQQQQSAQGSQPQKPSNIPPNQPMLVANAATMGMSEFVMKQIAKRAPGLAAKAAGLSLADGPFPIGEIIALGLTASAAYEIYQEWQKYQQVMQSTHDHGGGKNSQHGKSEDRPSDLKRLKELEDQLKTATGSEKKKIQTRINNLKKEMAARRKGENHSQKPKK
jgi:hypothetical protein